jgi:hypothetical protein
MKPRIRILAAAAAIVTLAACERTVTADERPLVGTWRADVHDTQGAQDQYAQLTFSEGGAYRYEYFMYGGYGHPASELTSYFRTDGAYRVNGTTLELKEIRQTTTDAVFPEQNRTTALSGRWAEAGTIEINGDHMVRRYYTYPADAPELTVMSFTRVTN